MDVKFSDLDSMIVFAKNNEGELVFVDDVKNGYVCNCFCLNCGERLNAKNKGTVKAHHFAHASGSDCKKGHENTIPLFIQRILNRNKWMLLPHGNIKFNGDYLGDYQTVSIVDTSLFKIEGYPSVVLLTTPKGKKIGIYAVLTDESVCERMNTYKNSFDNLIELDIRNYRNTELEVEPVLNELLTHRRHQLSWIKRYDEEELIKRIKEVATRKSFGFDIDNIEHFYCPLDNDVITSRHRSCHECQYCVLNVIENSNINKCMGFMNHPLSSDSIMSSAKPDWSNIKGPSFLEMHAKWDGRYYWMYLCDIPKAYPGSNYVLIYTSNANKVFLVSLKSFARDKYYGIEIDPEGISGTYARDLAFYYAGEKWRVCSLANYKIRDNDVEKLNYFI